MSSLLLHQQNSLGRETVSTDGLERDIHVVVKNLAFTLHLALAPANAASISSFKGAKLSAGLVYDSSVLRYVDFLHTEPLTYVSQASDDGSTCRVEIKILVLSSKFEDSNFRILFQLCDPSTQELLHPSLTVLSEPIKVVSKPEQVGKAKNKQKRVTATEKIYQNVADIQSSQLANTSTLDLMAKRLDELTALVAHSHSAAVANKKRKLDELTPSSYEDETVEDLAPRLVRALARVAHADRPAKLCKVVADLASVVPGGIPHFDTSCPHLSNAQKYQSVDQFFSDFLKDEALPV